MATFIKSPSQTLIRTASWLVSIALPFVLVLTAVRLLLTPAYVHLEYRTPDFPADPYGFTLEDRLNWSIISLEYLVNDAGINFLADLTFDDGVPIYNERELGHMVDVKNVVQVVLGVWLGGVILVLALGIWAWRSGWIADYRLGLARGAYITMGFIGFVVVFMAISFQHYFVFFHQIFFAPGTWTFLYSDTLIRLFPERFWRDTFLWAGGISVLGAILVLYLVNPRRG